MRAKVGGLQGPFVPQGGVCVCGLVTRRPRHTADTRSSECERSSNNLTRALHDPTATVGSSSGVVLSFALAKG